MSLVYGLVSRGIVVLVEYFDQPEQGSINSQPPPPPGTLDAPQIARFILREKVSKEPGPHKRSFGHQKHNFHYKVDEYGICYLVAVLKKPNEDTSSNVRIPYKCIEEIASEFMATCGGSLHEIQGDGALNDIFARVIQEKIQFWNNPEADTLLKTKQKVGVVKEQMINNIDNFVKRGDAMNSLEERATLLTNEASDLKMQTNTMKQKIWWKQKKCQIIMCVACVVATLVILLALYIGMKLMN